MTTEVSPNLPPAARKQIKEANRLIAELNAKPGDAPAGAPDAAGNTDGLPSLTIQPLTGAPDDAPPQGAQPVAAAAPDADAGRTDLERAEARYKALQGKYNKTEREMAEMRGMLEAIQQTNRLLMENAQRAPVAPAAPVAPMKPEDQFRALGVTDQELKDYGPELLDIVARVSGNLSRAELLALRTEVNQLKQGMGNVSTSIQQNAQEKVYSALFEHVGKDWPTINNSEEFLAWLQDVDVFSGTRRLDGLQSAFARADAARVVAIFKAYIDGKTPSGSTSRQPAVARETLVAPGVARGGAGEAPGSTGGKIWSEKEITDFYQRARKGKVPAEEYAATEQEIARAVAEGRVRVDRPQHHSNA